ncbi:MAG: hypothetical protein EBR82_66135, partial [Caulobacteraceae bacterium]|nr:hypothetical protein [Caulobacteraceae bacterium]
HDLARMESAFVNAFLQNRTTGQKPDKTFVHWTNQLVQIAQPTLASMVAIFCIRAAITKNPVRKW